MKDVAAAAGVSIKTVSRVVNGEDQVSPGTRQVVEDAVLRLGYVRNEHAAALRRTVDR
ncbi:LacI family DNA-binding transcriptional regulator [Nocardioides pocheonensis]|uniref:LacI family transcriptional regulator n=1 Tax=Nocardioides pocheonensis TaxID=661485 RepID=A0A3N0GLA4_9ACTN|nr:LacI family DNA-binding transcriptional regulator [Nocardioides pocheonensis]RNM12820.1 LacI family transcriptional regulator [Nocardioides pocheonensis]